MTIPWALPLLLSAPLQDRALVDTDVPAGNAIVESVEGDVVTLRPDLRDTEGSWFYWRVRARGAQGRTLTFRFTAGNPVGVLGPAVSLDGGLTWTWHGKKPTKPSEFAYTFGPDARDVQFCMGIPYLERDLRAFLKRHESNPHLQVRALCTSEKGREVERLHAGRLDGKPRYRAFLTARHHACEMAASYVLEGILEEVLAGDEDGRWLREHVELLAVPFMDKDGVEDGDQGKNRKGRDHNRDYAGESHYASVRAVRALVPEWSGGKLRLMLDVHCPGLRGAEHEVIHFIGQADPRQWEAVGRFSAILESAPSGALKFSAKHNLPFGKSWNNAALRKPGQETSAHWAWALPGVALACGLEVPYANAGGQAVTPESARAFGKDLAKAIRRYLEREVKE
jgi:hypothetical protein